MGGSAVFRGRPPENFWLVLPSTASLGEPPGATRAGGEGVCVSKGDIGEQGAALHGLAARAPSIVAAQGAHHLLCWTGCKASPRLGRPPRHLQGAMRRVCAMRSLRESAT